MRHDSQYPDQLDISGPSDIREVQRTVNANGTPTALRMISRTHNGENIDIRSFVVTPDRE